MSELAWEKLQNKIDKVPPALANLLTDNKTSGFIEALTQKYIQLSVQGPDMARLIRDVAIADVFIGDMPQELSRRLGIDQVTAREVANQIVSQLFTPVLEDLKKVHREKFPGRLPAKSTASNAPPTIQPPTERHYQGEELPESGGNLLDLSNLRKMSND